MTTATAPAPTRIGPDTEEVLRLLAAGKTVQFVSDSTSLPRPNILRLIQKTKGWLHDPERDTVYAPGQKGMVPQLPDGVSPTAPEARPEPAPDRQEHDDTIDGLILRARQLDDKTVERQLKRTLEAIARLSKTVSLTEHEITKQREQAEAKKAALARIQDLERELANARAQARQLGARHPLKARPTTARDGVTPAQYREWAAVNGFEVKSHGRIPQTVVDAYHTQNGTPTA